MAETARQSLDATAMTCAACSARVTKAAQGVPGVQEAVVNLLNNSMELSYGGNPATIAAVSVAVEKAGYGAIPRGGAPAADAVADGDLGADIAIESADIVLMRNDVRDVAVALGLSRATMRIIKQNLFWALFYNVVCIPIAAGVLVPFGIALTPTIAAACMSASSVCVVTNALRLRGWKPPFASGDPGRGRGEHVVQIQPVNMATVEVAAPEPIERKQTMEKTIDVTGMMCKHCVHHVTKALEGIEGVESVRVSLDDNTAVADVPETVTDEALVAVIVDAGYEATVR